MNDSHANWALNIAHDFYPREVCEALIQRLERGLDIPYRSEDLLRGKGFRIDEGPLAAKVFDLARRDRAAGAASCVIGPQTIARLIDRILQLHGEADRGGRWTDQARTEHYALGSRISNSDLNAFMDAVLARSESAGVAEIGHVAEMIARHGAWSGEVVQHLSPEKHAACASMIGRWTETLISSEQSTRAQLAALAQAIEKVPDPTLFTPLSHLLAEDLMRHKTERAAFLQGLNRGRQIQNGSTTSWHLQYRRAFFAIRGQDVADLMVTYLPDAGYCGFGETAAWVLKEIRDSRLGPGARCTGVLRSEFAAVSRLLKNVCLVRFV